MKKTISLHVAFTIVFWGLWGINELKAGSFMGNYLQLYGYLSSSTPPYTFSPVVFPVVTGNENLSGFLWSGPGLTLDVSDQNIFFNFIGPINFGGATGGFYGWIFYDVNSSIDKIVGVTINPSTNMQLLHGTFDATDVTFDENRIYLNFDNLFVSGGSKLSLDVEFESVPEPSLILLLGLGLGAVTLVGWRFKS
jgi:hypothetical protein